LAERTQCASPPFLLFRTLWFDSPCIIQIFEMGPPQNLGNLHSFVRVFDPFFDIWRPFFRFCEIWRDLVGICRICQILRILTLFLTPFFDPFFEVFGVCGFGKFAFFGFSGNVQIWEIWEFGFSRMCRFGNSGFRGMCARAREFPRGSRKGTPPRGPYRPLFKCGCAFLPGRSLGGHFCRIALKTFLFPPPGSKGYFRVWDA